MDRAGLAIALVLALAPSAGATRQAPTANLGVPPAANTKDASAPFHVDLTGLDLGTSPPTRDPRNPAYPSATELPDGALPPAAATGNFILGPTHRVARDSVEQAKVTRGRILSFTFSSADSLIYRPGLVREEASRNAAVYGAATAPGDPSDLIVKASRQGNWVRLVKVYVAAGVTRSRPAPLLVVGDGESGTAKLLLTVLDNLVARHRIPPLVAVLIGAGGQDAQGSERGREYDTVSGTYAAWVESEVLPEVERRAGIRLSRDPSLRATMGLSSSGAAAFTMAWFRPDLYRRVLAFSPTFVNQQWPHDPALPGGAWEFHSPWPGPQRPGLEARGGAAPVASESPIGSPLLAGSARKPIRFWFSVGDRDLFYPIPALADGMHDWVLANENMARALAAKGYAYQFVFARDSGHVDPALVAQTLPGALEWLWADASRPVK